MMVLHRLLAKGNNSVANESEIAQGMQPVERMVARSKVRTVVIEYRVGGERISQIIACSLRHGQYHICY